jgi:hypothetical protein
LNTEIQNEKPIYFPAALKVLISVLAPCSPEVQAAALYENSPCAMSLLFAGSFKALLTELAALLAYCDPGKNNEKCEKYCFCYQSKESNANIDIKLAIFATQASVQVFKTLQRKKCSPVDTSYQQYARKL